MKRSDFLQMACMGGLAVACGAQKKQTTQKGMPVNATAAANGDPYDWKPGEPITIHPVDKSQAEWRKQLTPKQFHILRGAGTEPPFKNAYWDNHKQGIYFCAACALPLYSSKTKFKSGTGWPSFYAPLDKKVVENRVDHSLGITRKEILCGQCGSHLGHLFHDGPQPTGLRYCMDSLALHFKTMKV